MANNFYDQAVTLFDGGWTSEDKDEMMAEFELTEEQAEEICEVIKKFEEENK